MSGENEHFAFVQIDDLKVVKLGDFILCNSRSGKNDTVWIRREDSLEGGDFPIEKLNQAIEKFFQENF